MTESVVELGGSELAIRDVPYGGIKWKRLSDGAYPIEAPRQGDVGIDLRSPIDIAVGNLEVKKIPLGISIELPPHTWAWITSRSSLASKGLVVVGGIIDSGYRGELIVLLTDVAGLGTHVIARGDNIAQLIVLPTVHCSIMESAELSETERGEGGFGSTDISQEELRRKYQEW